MDKYMRKLDSLFDAYADIGFSVAARVPQPDDEMVKNGIFTIHGKPKAVGRNGKLVELSGTYEQHSNTIAEFRKHVAAGDDLNWPVKE